jgi:hypothetical protein
MSPGIPIDTANSLTELYHSRGGLTKSKPEMRSFVPIAVHLEVQLVYGRLRLVTSLRYLAAIWTCGP